MLFIWRHGEYALWWQFGILKYDFRSEIERRQNYIQRFKIKFLYDSRARLTKVEVWSSMRKKFQIRQLKKNAIVVNISTYKYTELNSFVDHEKKKELVRPVLLDKLLCITLPRNWAKNWYKAKLSFMTQMWCKCKYNLNFYTYQ